MSNLARSKEQMLFVTIESIPGTFVVPTTDDSVVLASSITASQSPSYTDSPEIQNTRGQISRFQDALGAGTFEFSLVPRCKGLGVAPVGAPLFTSLMGVQSITPATKVEYRQSLQKPSVSIAFRKGHVVSYLLGATVHNLSLSAQKKGPVTLSLSGQFMRRLIMGDDSMAQGAIATDTVITVGDAGRFMVGGRVYNPAAAANAGQADHNNGQGYEIVGVNTQSNQLTLATGLAFAWAMGEEVKGFLPNEALQGTPIEGRESLVRINGTAGRVKSMDLTINDPCQYLEDEINGLDYPTEYVEGDRKIDGKLVSYFRKEDSAKLVQGLNGTTEVALRFDLGQPGAQMRVDLAKVPLEAPSESEDGPTMNLTQSFVALETNGEDSCVLTFA